MTLKAEILNGVFWTAVQRYSGIVVQLIVSGVLARLIVPEDFGIVAIAIVLIQFLNIFADMGIGSAIIQNNNLSKKDLNDIYSATIYIGFFLSVLFFLASYCIASFYEKKALILICRILSLNLFFLSLNVVPNSLVLKNKQFKFIAKRTLLLQIVCGILSILAACNGLGIYALLIAPVLTTIAVFIVNYRKYPQKFYIKFNIAPLRKIFSYSVYQFLFNFINYFSRNLDKLIIGKYLTLSELGYYEKSYRLMMLPLDNVTSVISPVIHPVLTTLQDAKAELAAYYNKIIQLLATISFPLGMLLYFSATEIVRIVFGPQWDNAIPVFRILSLSLPFQMILSSIGPIYKVAGKTNWMFYSGLANSIITITGFLIGTFYFKNIEAVAWSWNITLVINMITSYLILYKIVLKSSVFNMMKTMLFPFINAFLVILVIGTTQHIYPSNIYLSMTVKTSVTLLISYLCVNLSGRYNINRMVMDKIKSIRKL